jgi:hypothetical protein
MSKSAKDNCDFVRNIWPKWGSDMMPNMQFNGDLSKMITLKKELAAEGYKAYHSFLDGQDREFYEVERHYC